MKNLLFILVTSLIVLVGCTEESTTPKEESSPKEEVQQEVADKETNAEEAEEVDFETEAEANAKEHPAKPGAMLYDKNEEKFKGMNYYFKGVLVKTEKVEGLFGNMEDALLVKNEQGYVLPIFPPYEVEASEGDEIEVWGPLSGDGYSSADLDVDNVVGVAGAINATRIDINGETK